jgi:hypothetical protein
VPGDALRPLPRPFRYELLGDTEASWCLVSAVLFFAPALPLAGGLALPIPHPRCQFRFCVRDAEDRPALLLARALVPLVALAGARAADAEPVALGRLRYPRPSRRLSEEGWWWTLRHQGRMVIHARPSSPQPTSAPSLGSWEQSVGFFRGRREYAPSDSGLRALERTQLPVAAWPLTAEVEESGLLAACLGSWVDSSRLRFHSAWLFPEVGAEPLRERFGELSLKKSRSPVAARPAMLSCAALPPDRRTAA